jgi:hypothetical protein
METQKETINRNKKLIYESFVRCHLLYGLIVWGPVGVKHEKLKKNFTKDIQQIWQEI